MLKPKDHDPKKYPLGHDVRLSSLAKCVLQQAFIEGLLFLFLRISILFLGMELPKPFIQQVETLLLDESESYLQSLKKQAPVSIRYNPWKMKGARLAQDAVPWCKEAYYLPERKSFTLDPHFHGGAYYVQEASSMVLDYCFRQALDMESVHTVLDLCAAPGGKSTLLRSLLPDDSLLVANELITSRFHILKENMTKWGHPNVLLTNNDSQDFLALPNRFDAILVDAPCSGEGLFRKQPSAVDEWSPDNVQLCAGRQRRILSNIIPSLKAGGVLCYSTCTMNRQENEENVDWMIETFDLEVVQFDFPLTWGVADSYPEKGNGYRMYPHRLQGEGFFFCFFKKKGTPVMSNRNKRKKKNWQAHFTKVKEKDTKTIPNFIQETGRFAFYEDKNKVVYGLSCNLREEMLSIMHVLKRGLPCFEVGSIKKDKLVPSAASALSIGVSEQLPRIKVDLKDALLFLKKEAMLGNYEVEKGWALVEFEGRCLGWVKVLPNRMNNYYPKEWRIRMSIE